MIIPRFILLILLFRDFQICLSTNIKMDLPNNVKKPKDKLYYRDKTNGKLVKHSSTEGGASTNAGSAADSGSGSSSLSAGDASSFTKTKVKTKISASSNAQSNSSAAARAKAFAKTNTETKIKTNLGTVQNNQKPPTNGSSQTTTQTSPFPVHKIKTTTPHSVTRPTHAYWSPSFVSPVTPSPLSSNSSSSSTGNNTGPPPSENKIICVNCPVPCPYPIVCPCPCPATPPTPSIVFCPVKCENRVFTTRLPPPPPPPPPLPPTMQIIPIMAQPAVAVPCSYGSTTCCPECVYPDYNCMPCSYACPCKRSLQREHTNSKKDSIQGIPQVEIYISHNYTYKQGAVAADNYKCSEIGRNILKKGGSAMDAAIAAHLCVEIVNCHSTGLGGGGFLIAYSKNKKDFFTVDFREQLPSHYNATKKTTQGDTILIPGVLKGLEMGHKLMGKLPWKDLFEEPIRLATEGFIMHEALAEAVAKKKDYILVNLGLREVFAPEGYILTLGQRVKRTKLAETYKKIADSGSSDIFYKGEFAMDIVKDVQEAGGSITLEDLKNYQAFVRDPISTKIANLTMYGIPPPASSVTVAMMLKLMEKFKWTKRTLKEKPGVFYHQMIEAMKFAYAPTTFLGDPKYVSGIDKNTKKMLDEDYLNKIFKKIDSKSHSVDYYGPFSTHERDFTGTSHISVVGPDGDAVSITSSINAHFGSRILSRRLGFIYNNELSDFADFWPKVYNFSKDRKIPGKRPVSKVSPLIFTDKNGEVRVVIGAAGGFFIPTALASTLSFYLFLHDNITTAISRPRIHCQLFPPTVVVEDTFPISIQPLLNQYVHQFVTNDTYSATGQSHAIMGVIQAIVRHDNGELEAACDYRKGGLPAGF